MEILARYLERTDRPVFVASGRQDDGARPTDGSATRSRACSATGTLTGIGSSRCRADIEQPGLGLSDAAS